MDGSGVVTKYVTILINLFASSIFLCVLLAFAPGLPPDVDYHTIHVAPEVPLTDKLTPTDGNSIDAGQKIQVGGDLLGPESFEIHDGHLYTGLVGGKIVRMNLKDGKYSDFIQMGSKCSSAQPLHDCSRPLGMRLDKLSRKLVVSDCNSGLYNVDLNTGEQKLMLSSDRLVNNSRIQIPNDLDIDKQGIIYFSDSSTYAPLHSSVMELLATPSGRILRYDMTSDTVEVVRDGLYFANGVQLSSDQTYLFVCETFRNQIYKLHVRGDKEGDYELFSNLPGTCDNLRLSPRGSLYVPLGTVRRDTTIEILGAYPPLRRMMLRFLHFTKLIADQITSMYYNVYTDNLSHKLFHLGTYAGLISSSSLVLELDVETGSVIRSWHGSTGSVFSEALEHDGHLYVGSPYNTHILKLKL